MQAAGPADIFGAKPPRVYSIDPGRPFLIDLARALRRVDDPLALADMTIFLPTRRAVRALTEAFAERAGGASLLPRLRALGDIDEEELLLAAPTLEAQALDLAPAVSLLERRLVLARLVAAADRAFAGQENWAGALGAADELGKLLDSFHSEEIDFARLERAAPEDHAAHWMRSLKFLEIVTRVWPAWLAGRGLIDPGERRARLIALQAEHFETKPPKAPVVVAGTTGSAPAVARLMRVVASLANGAVVLPGLDRALVGDAKAWEAVDDPHPQAGLKAVLEALGVAAPDVRPWPGAPAPSPRNALLLLALRPAAATDDWRALVTDAALSDPGLGKARAGLAMVEAADEDGEASAVAILMREALETPGRTAMLATPDRDLGRRVAAKLRRWHVAIDDSAGTPFANSPCGTYLRLAAHWLADPSDPVALLSLARHPLAGFGLGDSRRAAIDALDKGLRGPAPGPGLDRLLKKLAADETLAERAAPVLEALRRAHGLWPDETADFADFLAAHVAAAELLAATDAEEGAARLWRGDDGEMGALLLAELKATAEALGRIAAGDYAGSFGEILAGASLRRRAAHPRLQILGPLEARLQSADLVILGGLNEGQWPADAAVDPFLSRRMRREIGLPSPERRLGLSAHDFAQAVAAPSVVLTRARQAGGAPAKPSRWIVRLKNILDGAGALAEIDDTARLDAWKTALDRPAAVEPVKAPKPKPPVAARPRKLYVTRFEDLMRDPYSVYARDILKLKALDKLAEPMGAAGLGLLLHAIFAEFVKAGETSRAKLGDILDRLAPDFGLDEAASAFWRPRLDASLDWFLAWERERRTLGAPAAIEGSGEHAFDVGGKPFTLAARADRIDLLADGSAALVDYKSGKLPTLNQIEASFSPQLPLTALIVEAGGFAALGKRPVSAFGYVKALNQKGGDEDFSGEAGDRAAALIEEAREGVAALVAHYDNPETVYLSQPRPEFMRDYADYDHLARRREWAAAEDGE